MFRNTRIQDRNGKVITNKMAGGDNRTGILALQKEYPDPRILPAQPSWQQPRPHGHDGHTCNIVTQSIDVAI